MNPDEQLTLKTYHSWWFIISPTDGVLGRFQTYDKACAEYKKLTGKDWQGHNKDD